MVETIKEIISEIIAEGAHEAEATRLSRLCINDLKDAFNSQQKFESNKFYTISHLNVISGKNKGELFFLVAFITDDNPLKIQFIEASEEEAWDGTGIIEVHMGIPVSWMKQWQKAMRAIVTRLKGVIRHEIEHMKQRRLKQLPKEIYVHNNEDFDDDQEKEALESWVKYALQPHEVEAWVVEAYKKAKMLKINMATALNKTALNRLKGFRKLSKKESYEIMRPLVNAWKAYAKKRFPHAVWSRVEMDKIAK